MCIRSIFQNVKQTSSEEALLCLCDIQVAHVLHIDLETGHSIIGSCMSLPCTQVVQWVAPSCSCILDHSDRTGGCHGLQNFEDHLVIADCLSCCHPWGLEYLYSLSQWKSYNYLCLDNWSRPVFQKILFFSHLGKVLPAFLSGETTTTTKTPDLEAVINAIKSIYWN